MQKLEVFCKETDENLKKVLDTEEYLLSQGFQFTGSIRMTQLTSLSLTNYYKLHKCLIFILSVTKLSEKDSKQFNRKYLPEVGGIMKMYGLSKSK